MMQIFEWFVNNWLIVTCISGGLYIAFTILEKCLSRGKSKKADKVSVKDADVEDVQI